VFVVLMVPIHVISPLLIWAPDALVILRNVGVPG
jgi:hypothetical protein